MTIEYDQILKCKSNPNFLYTIDPREIINKYKAKFISCKLGGYYFVSQSYPIHEAILELSEKYSEEMFEAEILNVDFYESAMHTIVYKNGVYEVIKVEPFFFYDYHRQLKKTIGENRFNCYLEKIRSFFEKLKDLYSDEWLESDGPDIYKKYDKISIQFEDEEFRVLATWDSYSHVSIEGFYKVTNQTSWKLIDGHSYIPINHKKK